MFIETKDYGLSIIASIVFLFGFLASLGEYDESKTKAKKFGSVLLSIWFLILAIMSLFGFRTTTLESAPIEYTLKRPLNIDIEDSDDKNKHTTLYLNKGDKVLLVIKDPMSINNNFFKKIDEKSEKDEDLLKESDWKNAETYILLDKNHPNDLIKLNPTHVKNQNIDDLIKELYKKEVKKRNYKNKEQDNDKINRREN